jgi:hypothetical protein
MATEFMVDTRIATGPVVSQSMATPAVIPGIQGRSTSMAVTRRYLYTHRSTRLFMCRSQSHAMGREDITGPSTDTPGTMATGVAADMEGAVDIDDPVAGRNGEAPGPPFRIGRFQAE